MTEKKKIDRIDLHDYRDRHPVTGEVTIGVLVCYYLEGWRAGSNPISVKVLRDASLEDKIDELKAWCEENGATWDIVSWPTGTRAFRGIRKPVRTRDDIMKMRHEFVQRHRGKKGYEDVQWHAVDFAYMF